MRDILHQYRIIREAAGWIDRGARGRVRVEGPDKHSFLQGLLTNDVAALQAGQGLYAAYLTAQGRMICDLHLYDRGDWLLAEVADGLAASLASRLDALIFAEDVRVADISAEWAQIGVIGERAAELAGRALAVAADLSQLPELAQVPALGGFISRATGPLLPAFEVFVPIAEELSVRDRLGEVGVVPIGVELDEALRIEGGRPSFGVDMTEDTIPLEAGLLDRAISTSKGCYVGQEVIARVLHRGGGRVARRLVRLAFDPALTASPAAGAELSSDSVPVGRITSVAFSPAAGRLVALGYVKREQAEAGGSVSVETGAGPATAEIVGLA